jgi:hypothetical protein
VEIVSALTPERLPGPAVAGVLHAEGFFPLPDAVDVVVSVLFQPADEIACLVEFLAQIGDAAVALRNVVFEFGGVSSRWWEAIQVASASLAARHLAPSPCAGSMRILSHFQHTSRQCLRAFCDLYGIKSSRKRRLVALLLCHNGRS